MPLVRYIKAIEDNRVGYVEGEICRRVLIRSNGVVNKVDSSDADAPVTVDWINCCVAQDQSASTR